MTLYRYIRISEADLYRRAGWTITPFDNHHGAHYALASKEG